MTTSARILLFVLTLSAVASAQTVAGTWQGATGNGTPLTLQLNIEGEALTGTLTRGNETTPITDGTVANNKIHFTATLGGQTESFSGELRGDALLAYLDRMGPEAAIQFKRVS